MSSCSTVVFCATLFFAAAAATSVGSPDSKDDRLKSSRSVPRDVPGLWASDLFYRALANFTVRNVGTAECRQQVDVYETNLRNHTSWAVRSKHLHARVFRLLTAVWVPCYAQQQIFRTVNSAIVTKSIRIFFYIF